MESLQKSKLSFRSGETAQRALEWLCLSGRGQRVYTNERQDRPKQRAGFTNGGAEAKAKGEGTNADTKEDKAI
jgi:hypothetical protein